MVDQSRLAEPDSVKPEKKKNAPRGLSDLLTLSDPDGLTVRQRAFVNAFILERDMAKACRAADIARPTGERYGRDPAVRGAIERELLEIAARHRITVDWVAERLRRIASGDIRDLFHVDGRLKKPHELSDDAAAAIAALEYEVQKTPNPAGGDDIETTMVKAKRADPIRALDLLAKWLRMYDEGPAKAPPPSRPIETANAVDAARAYAKLIGGEAT